MEKPPPPHSLMWKFDCTQKTSSSGGWAGEVTWGPSSAGPPLPTLHTRHPKELQSHSKALVKPPMVVDTLILQLGTPRSREEGSLAWATPVPAKLGQAPRLSDPTTRVHLRLSATTTPKLLNSFPWMASEEPKGVGGGVSQETISFPLT